MQMLGRSLAGVSAVAFVVLIAITGFLGFAIVDDVLPQLGSVGVGGLELGHLLGPSWAANAALVTAVGTGLAAVVVLRRERRRAVAATRR